ncbi:hypothetical protein IAU60_003775 [Kwoniella sp. DSM 27419]
MPLILTHMLFSWLLHETSPLAAGLTMTKRKTLATASLDPDNVSDIELISASDSKRAFKMGPELGDQPSHVLSSAPSINDLTGPQAWKGDLIQLKAVYGHQGEVEGYAGMMGIVRGVRAGEADHSISAGLQYEDLDGKAYHLRLELVFDDLETYPSLYKLLVFSETDLPRRAETTISRFATVYDTRLKALLGRLLASLQGDDDADGGFPVEVEGESDQGYGTEEEVDPWVGHPGRGIAGNLGGVNEALDMHTMKAPGLTAVSDYWIITYSIPLTDLPIDPNLMAMWDDGLVETWRNHERITLLMSIESYPPRLDDVRFWLGTYQGYKPPHDLVTATMKGHGLPGFYLSASLEKYLKVFARCFKLRTSFSSTWKAANAIGMDDEASRKVFIDGDEASNRGQEEADDPVARGMQENIPLCAFWWTLERFKNAPKYCLNCGLEVAIPSLRPYVCDQPLCLYGFMSLGLGPSIEHTIINHPSVVDLLLSLAHASASGTSRMEMPLHLHIEVPVEFGIPETKLIDELAAGTMREALVWLIDRVPKISGIRSHLLASNKLNTIEAPSGSIGVLRWVIGSCRAYLKETKPDEGVQVDQPSNVTVNNLAGGIKQFTFVVGSPQQEKHFREEIEKAQAASTHCKSYPTLLAFHGSNVDRWHNILRTGLDFTETVNGRAYGNGVYFASDSMTSMGTYATRSTAVRSNAHFVVNKATALVELVNVPHSWVSSSPYYVVANTKQIKPFLLLVQGLDAKYMEKGKAAEEEEVPVTPQIVMKGDLFKHDPTLSRKPQMFHGPLKVYMPEKLEPVAFVDDDPDDVTDHAIFHPAANKTDTVQGNRPKTGFDPSPSSRFEKLELLPPPTETSIVATKTLGKELKALIETQEHGELPFYIDPDGEKHEVPSIITELRFPATFPHSPPFMRILHPRMLPFMLGGGGNITGGGSVCNELMTATGWNPAFNVESIVREVMTNMTEATPPARLDPRRWNDPYTMREAIEAYKRVANAHGWQIPQDFDRLAAEQ